MAHWVRRGRDDDDCLIIDLDEHAPLASLESVAAELHPLVESLA